MTDTRILETSTLPQTCPMCGSQRVADGYVAQGANYAPLTLPPFFRGGQFMESVAYTCGIALYIDPHPDQADRPEIFAPIGEHCGHKFGGDGCRGHRLDAWLVDRNASTAL